MLRAQGPDRTLEKYQLALILVNFVCDLLQHTFVSSPSKTTASDTANLARVSILHFFPYIYLEVFFLAARIRVKMIIARF
jgi:hypothetical protein